MSKPNQTPVADSIRLNMQRLIATGGLVGAAAFRAGMGMSEEVLETAVRERRVFRFDWDGEHWFPAFMMDAAASRKHLEQVTQALGDLSAGSKMAFFTHPRGSLATQDGCSRTPLEAIRDGCLDKVLRSAQACVRS